MTEKNTTSFLKRVASRGTLAVVPLVFLCSLAMAGYMAAGYIPEQEDTATHNAPADETDIQPSDISEPESEVNGLEDAVVIAQYNAASQSEEPGRIENIRLASESIDGTIIDPGAVFSFNELIGDIEYDERYQLAPVVNGNEMIYGRGGGSCQVSSALYNAALRANLDIVERHAHSTVVDYVPIGLDATVVYGLMDLKIANNSTDPIMIVAEPEGQSVTIKIMGQPLEEGLLINPVSSLIEYHEAGTPVPNALEWDPVLENTTYYIVESYLEYYYHGNKTDTVLLARDMYKVPVDSTVRMPDGNLDTTK